MTKKRILLLGIIITIVSILGIVGISYASWRFTNTQGDFNTLGTKCFEVTIEDASSGITLDKAYPISDAEGKSQEGYTFTVKNKCSTNAFYQVNLEELALEVKKLSNEYVKVSVNDSTGKNLNTYEEVTKTLDEAETSHKLTSGVLGPAGSNNDKATYNVKLWMDEDTPIKEEVMNATFKSKVSVVATYVEESDLTNEIVAETKSLSEYNRESETIEVTVTSTNYKIIEVSEDGVNWEPLESPGNEVVVEKIYIEVGIHQLFFRDEVNNIKKIVFETQKLDQITPEISYEVTNKDGILDLSITYTDDNSGLAGYQITDEAGVIQRIITEPTEWINISGKVFTTTYEIKENKTYYLWVKDTAGNIKYITYSSTDVDTLAPTLTISNSLTTWGLKDSIHLIATDNLAGINAYSISKNENEYNWQPITNTLRYETEIEVTENNTYYISVKDAYNHITTESIIIEKIDINSPVIDQVILNKNVDSIITEVVATDQESDIQKIYYQIDDEDEVVSDILTHTFEKLSEGTHTVTVIVEDNVGNKSSKSSTLEIFYNKKIEILAFNGTIKNGKTLKNYIKNGSYESDLYEWEVPYQKPEISNNSYSGSNSLKFPASTGTIMTKQKLDISHPELNHTYYGSIMVNSNEGYKVSDGRYEFFYTDALDALLVYAQKNKDTKGQWLKMSSIQTLYDIYSQLQREIFVFNTD